MKRFVRLQFLIYIQFFCILLLSQNINAEPLTLELCLQKAKEYNPLLQMVRWDRTVAEQQIRQSDSSLYPRVDIQGGYTSQLEAQAIKMNNQELQTQQSCFGFANLSVTQTIYDFGRSNARRNQARTSARAVESSIKTREQEISLQVIETYFTILETQRLISAANEETRMVREHLKVAETLFNNGVVTRNDLLQADVRLASAQQKLLGLQNLAVNLRLRLNFLIGDQSGQLHELQDMPIPYKEPLLQDEITEALAIRSDLDIMRRQVDVNKQMVIESKALFYPELFARASMDYLQNNRLREQTIYAATVGLKINLFDGFTSTATLEKALNSQSKSLQQLRLAEEQAKLEIISAKNDLQVAKKQIAVTKEAIAQAKENLRINQNRYQEMAGTATEVLDAQTLITQVRTEYYKAVYDYQIASARLRKALGRL